MTQNFAAWSQPHNEINYGYTMDNKSMKFSQDFEIYCVVLADHPVGAGEHNESIMQGIYEA